MSDAVKKPWGGFIVLEKGESYQIKRLWVSPKHRLSLQSHKHRDEYWVILKGPAQIQIKQSTQEYTNGQGTYIPRLTPHRLSNPTDHIIEIIEIQYGTHINEADITRYEDDYQR